MLVMGGAFNTPSYQNPVKDKEPSMNYDHEARIVTAIEKVAAAIVEWLKGRP